MTTNNPQGTEIKAVVAAFLADRRVQSLAPGTVRFYVFKLKLLQDYAAAQGVTTMQQIDADLLRRFFASLQPVHNPGGIHAAFRAAHALLNWYDVEYEPPERNPMRKLKAPRTPEKILEPADEKVVEALIDSCDRHTLSGIRDRSILLTLIETGLRASELCSLDRTDLDTIQMTLHVRCGKGGVPRYVIFGKRTKLALRAYLKLRTDSDKPLFMNREGDRLEYEGLRDMISRRAADAGVAAPPLHGFRRAFALRCLRGGMDLLTLKRLMGHRSTAVLSRYVKLNLDDLRKAVNDLDE